MGVSAPTKSPLDTDSKGMIEVVVKVNDERMNMSTTVQVATLPKCDICQTLDAEYDGATFFGPWAYMCEPCWNQNGVGKLGTGFGQRLEVK